MGDDLFNEESLHMLMGQVGKVVWRVTIPNPSLVIIKILAKTDVLLYVRLSCELFEVEALEGVVFVGHLHLHTLRISLDADSISHPLPVTANVECKLHLLTLYPLVQKEVDGLLFPSTVPFDRVESSADSVYRYLWSRR